MKSHHKYRFWFISLVVHLCLAIALSVIIINQTTLSDDVDAIDVSILKVEPLPLVKKTPRIHAPVVVPAPTPKFEIEPQSTSAQTRTLTTRQVRSTAVSVPKAAAMAAPASQPSTQPARTEIAVQGASHANDRPTQSLATAVDLPVQSDAPLAAGMSGGSSLSGSGLGEGSGSGVGRGAFGLGGGVGQAQTRGRAGIGSLVGAEGASNIEDTLSDVSDKVTLGGGVPELPSGPGAIVVGRGRDIMGRLNLARFEDPLHPSGDI